MSCRSDIPNLTVRILAVCTEQRAESTELIPTGIQLSPFLVISIFTSSLVEFHLTSHITVLYTESADVHGPIRDTADSKVQAGRDLRFHIFPTGSDVTTPGGGRIALQSCKAGTCQQEDALVRFHAALSVIDSFCIHQCVCIEELGRGAKCRRAAKVLAVLQIRTVAYVRFAGIHPPSVNTQRIVVVLHLLPEELACIGIVCVIERAQIARTDPVFDAVFDSLLIHPTFFVKFLEVFGRSIELGPYGNHQTSVHGVDGVDHSFRVGETFGVELMASPRILLPVQPVDYDIVDRNLTFTEFLQGGENLLTRIVLLTALPVTHRPFRHNLGFTCQCTVAANHIVHIITINEIVVYFILHFTPPGEFVLFFISHRTQYPQTAVRNTGIRLPLYLQRNALARFQIDSKLITVRIPSRTPTFGNHQFIINIYFHVACIVKDEAEQAAFCRFYFSLINYVGPSERELRRQINHLTQMCGTVQMFKIKRILTTYKGFHVFLARNICTGQSTFLALFIIKFEDITQL